MASRSVYELPDVAATLLYALQTHKYTLIFQTAREIHISGESELLTNLVTFAWLLCDPFVCSLPEPPSSDTVYESLCTIAPIFPTSLPDNSSPFPFRPPADHEMDTFQAAVHTCISKKLWKHAYRILTPLLHTNQIDVLTRLFEPYSVSKTHFRRLGSILYIPVTERLLLHIIVQAAGLASHPVANLTKYSAIWNKPVTGGCSDRTFSIPKEALHTWNVLPKTIDHIQFSLLPPAIVDSHASYYWINACKEPKTEEWYATYFPDDIPDEWSKEECAKSHVFEVPSKRETFNTWTAAFLLCWS
jgi:hypothetical protein